MSFMLNNIFYVLRLTTPNALRGLGWAKGQSTPPGYPEDQVYDEDGHMIATFHWVVDPADPHIGSDTVENVTEHMDLISGDWKHFKFYNDELTGFWLITDLQALIDVARGKGLDALADFLETSPLIERNGDIVE